MTESTETETNESQTDSVPAHADKYNDPRAKITRRGILLGVLVAILGVIGSAVSIYARRTRVEKTTEFWGESTITAFRLGERIHLSPGSGKEFETVELTRTPGIGHFRRMLLDQRNYDWSTVTAEPIAAIRDANGSYCMQVKFSDPPGNRFEDLNLCIDLADGWIGAIDRDQRMKISERKRNALKNFLEQVVNYREKRAAAEE